MKKFTYDMTHQIEPTMPILSTVWHKHLGVIHNIPDGVNNVFNMNSFNEISFDVHKYWDDIECDLWDQLISFKYVYIPSHDEYYEIYVSMDETDDTIKHITGKSAGATELGSRNLIDLHINDETDINYGTNNTSKDDDSQIPYDTKESDLLPGQTELIKATVLYREILPTDSEELARKKKRASLLHRVLADKCPDWSIGHVADTVSNIQRTFTASGTSVYDFLVNTVGKEIECLFVFDSVNRVINVYDLLQKCIDCKYRGTFVEACPKCGSTHFINGHGKRTGIFFSTDNYAENINISGNTDNVKNCLRMVAGDDDMTAAVRNCNPNGSQYIYHFSEAMLNDMPQELRDRIESYNVLCDSKKDEYADLTKQYYDYVDEILNLESKMMPDTPIPGETTAEEQLNILESTFKDSDPPNVAVDVLSKITRTTASNAVKTYARVLIDPRYTVEIYSDSDSITPTVVTENTKKVTWSGKFIVTALGTSDDSKDPDQAISTSYTIVTIVGGRDNYETFCEQSIQKTLDRADYALTTIVKIEDDDEFKKELKKYCLDRLESFESEYKSVTETLSQVGVTQTNQEVYGADVYDEFYEPYSKRIGYIQDEIKVREGKVNEAKANRDAVNAQRRAIQEELDFQDYLGEDLFKIYSSYRKEGEYNNSNYISTKLDNSQLMDKAEEFLAVASDEVIKASEIEITISESLKNLLSTKEFAEFKDGFDIGDWIVTSVDGVLYRLRLIGVTYNDSSPDSISFSFSNVDRMQSISDDVEAILSKAQSVANTYNAVTHQAKQGDEAKDNVDDMQENGVDSSVYNILAGTNNRTVIDEHGILLKMYDDVLGEDSPEQIKMINNTIAFTDDNWKHVKTALGKLHYILNGEEKTSYGLNAETMIAGLMIAGQIYSTNWSDDGAGGYVGTHFDLETGQFVIGGGGIIYDPLENRITIGENVIVNDPNGNPVPVSDITDIEVVVSGKQDKLTAGNNITIDSSNVISADIEANPETASTATLTKLLVGDTVYSIDCGTEIIPNPQDEPTETLEKIGIDGTVYEVSGGMDLPENWTLTEHELKVRGYGQVTPNIYGWGVSDTTYYTEEQMVWYVDGREFVKTYATPALVAGVKQSSSFYGSVAVSTNMEATYFSYNITSYGPYEYKGYNWYLTGFNYSMPGGRYSGINYLGDYSSGYETQEEQIIAIIHDIIDASELNGDMRIFTSMTEPSSGIILAGGGEESDLSDATFKVTTDGSVRGTDFLINNVSLANVFTGADGTDAGVKGLVPAPSATDNLKFLRGDGTWADAGGGGGGGSYSTVDLWTGPETPSTAGMNITLTDNISNYDAIYFAINNNSYGGTDLYFTNELVIGNTYIGTVYGAESLGAYWTYTSDTQINIKRQASAYPVQYSKVVGIKFGNTHNYSTSEQVVGTWVDGKTIYERSINLGSFSVPTSGEHIIENITNIDTFVKYTGYIIESGIKYCLPDPATRIMIRTNNNLIFQGTGGSWIVSEGYVTIQYTKTT